jgi:hypothetical protein
MTLFTFATYPEAAPTIEKLQARALLSPTTTQLTSKPQPTLYKFEKGWILLTGIGSLSTLTSLLTFPYPYKTLYNFGLAGSFIDEDIGKIKQVGSAVKMESKFDPPLTFGSGDTILTTCYTLSDPSVQKKFPNTRLVDMEGYALALAAKKLGKKLYMWKIVSDIVSNRTVEQIASHLPMLAYQLSTFIVEDLSNESSRYTQI